MIVKYEKHIKKSELEKVLIQIFKNIPLSKGSLKEDCKTGEYRGFREGSALTVGIIAGRFGIDPDRIVSEAKNGKGKDNEHD